MLEESCPSLALIASECKRRITPWLDTIEKKTSYAFSGMREINHGRSFIWSLRDMMMQRGTKNFRRKWGENHMSLSFKFSSREEEDIVRHVGYDEMSEGDWWGKMRIRRRWRKNEKAIFVCLSKGGEHFFSRSNFVLIRLDRKKSPWSGSQFSAMIARHIFSFPSHIDRYIFRSGGLDKVDVGKRSFDVVALFSLDFTTYSRKSARDNYFRWNFLPWPWERQRENIETFRVYTEMSNKCADKLTLTLFLVL